jgi:hypothetical protein
MEQLIVDLKKIMVRHIRKNEWDKVEYIKKVIDDINVATTHSLWEEIPYSNIGSDFHLKVSCNIKHHQKNLCSYIIEQLGINDIESYKKFDFNTLIWEIPNSKIEAFKELQNRFINEIH